MLDFYEVAAGEIAGLALLILTPNEAEARPPGRGPPAGAAQFASGASVPSRCPSTSSAADAGICFLGDHHSKAASSPTKYGEYLASGLAVVTNPWTGDAASTRRRSRLDPGQGVFTREPTPPPRATCARKLEQREELRHAARALARRSFSLDDALDRYDGLYRRVLEAGP